MRGYWAQPSLSRDFALLAAAIVVVLFTISAWVSYTTYTRHTEEIASELEKEAARVERTLGAEMESANYMLTALVKQIAKLGGDMAHFVPANVAAALKKKFKT